MLTSPIKQSLTIVALHLCSIRLCQDHTSRWFDYNLIYIYFLRLILKCTLAHLNRDIVNTGNRDTLKKFLRSHFQIGHSLNNAI